MNRYRRLLAYLKPYRLRVGWAFACMILLALTTAAYAFLVGPVLAFLVTGDWKLAIPSTVAAVLPSFSPSHVDRATVLMALPVVIVVIALVKGLSYAGQFYLMGTVGQDVVADLRRDVFSKLVSLSPSFYAKRHTADLYSRVGLDVQSIEYAIVWALASYGRDTLQVLVLLGEAFWLDWRLALIAFGALPLMIVPVVRFARSLKRITVKSNEAISEVMQTTHEALQSIRVVQAFAMEDKERERFSAAVQRYIRTMRKSLLIRGTSTPTMEVLAVVGFSAAVAYAGHAMNAHALDGRTLMSFVATVMLMIQPAKSLGRVGNFMMQGLAGADRIYELLDAQNDITDLPGAREVPPLARALSLEAVSLDYTGEDGQPRRVLSGIDLTVKKGEVVALVGPSGAGKTSLVNLVPRFYDATEGRLSIDGVDLKAMTLKSLRSQIAVVTQETLLFNESVAANIAYGRPGATSEEIERAARAADAHDFILALPHGYDTRIGEKGVTLSGGQRQRLAIARAILKDAPILILDEATSSLDSESEAEVQRALERLMEDRTVLVVAHRLSTIRRADRIVVLMEGRIIEEGTHGRLVEAGGEYARMLAIASGGPMEARSAAEA